MRCDWCVEKNVDGSITPKQGDMMRAHHGKYDEKTTDKNMSTKAYF